MFTKLDSRAQRTISAIVSSLVGRFVILFAPFVATPAMLHYFGDADFGLWVTAVSLTSIAVVADLGIGNGMLTRVAAAYGRGDAEAIRRYVSSAFAVVGAVAVVLMGGTLLGFWFFQGSIIILMVFVVFILGMPGAAFYQMLFAVQRVPMANAVQTVGAGAAVASALAAIHFSLPSWMVALAYAMPPVMVTYGACVLYFARRSEYRPSLAAVDWARCGDLLHLGARFFVLSILTASTMNVDNIVISLSVGPEAAAAYAIPMRLGSLLTLVILAIYMPMWGANGDAIAKGEFRWVRRSAVQMSVIGAAIVLALGGVLLLASDWIIQLWVGRAFENQRLVLAGFVLLSTVTAITSPFNMVLNAMGRVTIQIWPWLAVLLLTVAAKIAIAPTAVWPFAALTGICYLAIILPVIIVGALRALRTAEEPSAHGGQ